jgi:hypothetical protein
MFAGSIDAHIMGKSVACFKIIVSDRVCLAGGYKFLMQNCKFLGIPPQAVPTYVF